MDLDGADWIKATRSSTTNNCVEVARLASVVGVRDTKDRDGGRLEVSSEVFDAFTAALKSERLS